LQSFLLANQELFHNTFNIFTHNPSYTSIYLFHPCVENSQVCYFIKKSANRSSWSGDFPSLDYGLLRLRSSVQGARDIMIHSIYRSQGTSLIIFFFLMILIFLAFS
jgi:hypothetical protein